jgi:hypothetical protein
MVRRDAQDRGAAAANPAPAVQTPDRLHRLRPLDAGPEQLAARWCLNVHVPVPTVLDLGFPGSGQSWTATGQVSAEHVGCSGRPACGG